MSEPMTLNVPAFIREPVPFIAVPESFDTFALKIPPELLMKVEVPLI